MSLRFQAVIAAKDAHVRGLIARECVGLGMVCYIIGGTGDSVPVAARMSLPNIGTVVIVPKRESEYWGTWIAREVYDRSLTLCWYEPKVDRNSYGL